MANANRKPRIVVDTVVETPAAPDASNSGVNIAEISRILAAMILAGEVEDYRTELGAFAGTGIPRDQVDGILKAANFTTAAKVSAAKVNGVRYVLCLGATGWKEIEDAAKAEFEAAKDSSAPISGNWTVIANAIAKRRVDEREEFEVAKAKALKAAKTKARGEIAVTKVGQAVKLGLREYEADFLTVIEDDKRRAKVEAAIALLEKEVAAAKEVIAMRKAA